MIKLCIFLVVLACVWTVTEQKATRLKIKNSKCKFPFTYKGRQYDSCTSIDDNALWCSLDAKFQDRQTDCLPRGCKFPFEYQGKIYHGCTNAGNADPEEYWCSEDAVYNRRYKPCPGYQEEIEVKREERREEVQENFFCVDQQKNKRKLGEQWTSKCITYLCIRDGVKAVDLKCQGRNERCYEVGKKDYPCVIQGINFDSCTCRIRDNRVFNHADVNDVGATFEPELVRPKTLEFKENKQKQREERKKVVEEEKIEKKEEEEKPEVFCIRPGGQRSQVGDRINVGCETHRCEENGKFRLVAAKCKGADGSCHEPGSGAYKCKENGQLYASCLCSGKQPNVANMVDSTSLIVEDKGCVTQDGRKVKAGERWQHGCGSFVCEKGSQINLLAAKCQDRDGNCQDIGAGPYKCLMNNRRYDDCVCKGDAKNPVSEGTIPEDAKDVKKTVVKMCFDPEGNVSAAWKVDCTEFVCENGETKVKRQRCRDDAEKCFDLNTKGFACTISGKRYQGCTCSLSNNEPTLSLSMG